MTKEQRDELEALVRESQRLAAKARQALDELDHTINQTVIMLAQHEGATDA